MHWPVITGGEPVDQARGAAWQVDICGGGFLATIKGLHHRATRQNGLLFTHCKDPRT